MTEERSQEPHLTRLVSLLKVSALLALLLILAVRLLGSLEGVLISDMRTFDLRVQHSVEYPHKEHNDKWLDWHLDRIQPELESKRPFFLVLQSDRNPVSGDTVSATASFPFTGDVACLSVFASTPPIEDIPRSSIADVSFSANDHATTVSFKHLQRPRRLDLYQVAPIKGSVHVTLEVMFHGHDQKRLSQGESSVVFDYLYIRECR